MLSEEQPVVDDLLIEETEISSDNEVNYDEYKKKRDHASKIRSEVGQAIHKNVAERNRWFIKEYSKLCGVSDDVKVDFSTGSIIRMRGIGDTIYTYKYNTMDMIVASFKIHDLNINKQTNYAVIFCEIDTNKTYKIYDTSTIHDSVFKYCSCSPSYISCDGEYRSSFFRYKLINEFREHNNDIWEEIMEYVEHIKKRRRWSCSHNYFYPKLEQERKNVVIEQNILKQSVSMTTLCISWFNTIYDEMYGMSHRHVNINHKSIFLTDKDADIEFIGKLIKRYGDDRVLAYRNLSTKSSTIAVGALMNSYGYKMLPLNIKEVQDPLKIIYKPWREYFVSAKCSDMVINCITPSLPITLSWFYIKNSKKGLYDNVAMYNKIHQSDIAKEILQMLNESKRSTLYVTEQAEREAENNIRKWINSKFKKLSDKIEDAIQFSISDIIMSEVTLAFPTEYVGRTFSDTIDTIKYSQSYHKSIGMPFDVSGMHYFDKYLFEICYCLLCINTKIGIIHGDLHLNNVTIGRLYNYKTTETKKEHRVMYKIEDKKWIFPNNQHFACVIDFSRSIIHPDKVDILRD